MPHLEALLNALAGSGNVSGGVGGSAPIVEMRKGHMANVNDPIMHVISQME